MNYTITHNEQFHSLEIRFDGKPAAEIREALKANRFRWHGQKKLWYGYSDETEIRALLDGKPAEAAPAAAEKPAAVNRFGVKVGDIFRATWGYDQTNNDFFQVVELVGKSSVRIREVHPEILERDATGPMAENRVLRLTSELLPPVSCSVFVKDQERGDLKRLDAYDENSAPSFKLASYARAFLCSGETVKVYESWYA